MVRLKGFGRKAQSARNDISIPHGTIKSLQVDVDEDVA